MALGLVALLGALAAALLPSGGATRSRQALREVATTPDVPNGTQSSTPSPSTPSSSGGGCEPADPELPRLAALLASGRPDIVLAHHRLVRSAAAPLPALAVGVQAQLRTRGGDGLVQIAGDLHAAGMRYTREDVTWSTIEQRPGVFCWQELDRIVAAAAGARLQIIGVVDSTPAWVLPDPMQAPTSLEARQRYAAFVAQLVGRYGTYGSFWAAHPDITPVPIVAWDIWNEPYTARFWTRDFPDPVGYGQMFVAAASAGRQLDPSAQFLLEAETTALLPGGGQVPFLEPMLQAVPRVLELASAISVHPYSSNGWGPDYCTPGTKAAARRFQVCRIGDIRQILDRHGGGHLPLWITEIGWSTAVPAPGTVDPATQARYVHTLFSALRGRWAGLVRTVVWYAYSTPEKDRRRPDDFFGLVHPDGSKSPAWIALRQEALR